MHYYQFNIGDYASATAHLEPLEDLAYRRLLDLYYSSESPIPLDLDKAARLIRMRPHNDCIAIVLSDFFTKEKDGYHCTRVDVELFKYKEKSHKASESAKARWSKSKEKQRLKEPCDSNANALETHSEGNANQEPLTINHKPVKEVKSIAINYPSVKEIFNRVMVRSPKIEKFNEKRKRLIRNLFKFAEFDLLKFESYLDYMHSNKTWDWAFESRTGTNGVNYKPCSFEYFMKEDTYLKAKEEFNE